jgi:hypothetical protein
MSHSSDFIHSGAPTVRPSVENPMNAPSVGTYARNNATISGHRVIRNPSPVTCTVSASQLSVAETFFRTEATPNATGFAPAIPVAPTVCATPLSVKAANAAPNTTVFAIKLPMPPIRKTLLASSLIALPR